MAAKPATTSGFLPWFLRRRICAAVACDFYATASGVGTVAVASWLLRHRICAVASGCCAVTLAPRLLPLGICAAACGFCAVTFAPRYLRRGLWRFLLRFRTVASAPCLLAFAPLHLRRDFCLMRCDFFCAVTSSFARGQPDIVRQRVHCRVSVARLRVAHMITVASRHSACESLCACSGYV